MAIRFILLQLILCSVQIVLSQESSDDLKEAPPYKLTRAEEDFSYLKHKENSGYEVTSLDRLKYIPISKSSEIYLSLGGQIRNRHEYFSNRMWIPDEDPRFYSQRLALHSNLVLGKYLRIFGELYHGYTSHQREFAEYDQLDFFQAFAEAHITSSENKHLSMRVGRQEMGLGANRLIGIREGPNLRRSYDMLRLIYRHDKTSFNAFYGSEVRPIFGAFDNSFSIWGDDSNKPQLWGLYAQFPLRKVNGTNELYYLGFHTDQASFNDASGSETRHTIGLRRYGKIGNHWIYNSEINYQFGSIGNAPIRAFSINADWHYLLANTSWLWSPGLKLEYSSGDRATGDGRINSFNPLFVNPAFYSLAASVTPVNLMSVHPSVNFKPLNSLKVYIEWAYFWRASISDGLYRPTRFINRQATESNSSKIGHQFGIKTQYEINRNISLDLDISYFLTGDFINESAESENILHIAPTASFKF